MYLFFGRIFLNGLANLDNHFQDFHRVVIIDSSEDSYENFDSTLNVQINIRGLNVTCFNKNFPSSELKIYLPNIAKLVFQSTK